MMLHRRAVLAIVLAAPASPRAADALQTLRGRLEEAAVLRGQFTQSRRISGFRHPLRSSGEFVLARGRGVLWLTRRPIVSTIVVTPDRMETRDDQGQRTQVLEARGEPALRTINTVLLAALSADLTPLRALFAIDAVPVGEAGWRLELTPIDKVVATPFVRITLSGERFVQSIRLDERGGDFTEVGFSGTHAAAALSAAEDGLLAGRGG